MKYRKETIAERSLPAGVVAQTALPSSTCKVQTTSLPRVAELLSQYKALRPHVKNA